MKGFFLRRIAAYAEYHRDWRNELTHIIGNPILFLAAVLPFSLLSVNVFGLHTNWGVILVIPALLFWIALDAAIGAAIVVVAIPLLWLAAEIAANVSVGWVWTIVFVCVVVGWGMQIFGHKYYEGGWPALVDNPIHMLMSPMFVFAKLYVALGFRPDLEAAIEPRPISGRTPVYRSEGRVDAGQHP
jgi:uncharacterized membrane protein YGL010W